MREEIKQRLLKHITFLETELKDFLEFKSLTKEEAEPIYNEFLDKIKKYLEKKITEDQKMKVDSFTLKRKETIWCGKLPDREDHALQKLG